MITTSTHLLQTLGVVHYFHVHARSRYILTLYFAILLLFHDVTFAFFLISLKMGALPPGWACVCIASSQAPGQTPQRYDRPSPYSSKRTCTSRVRQVRRARARGCGPC